MYSKKSYQTIRYGIQKHFEKIGVDIINDKDLKPANDMFKAMLVKLKSMGLGTVQHKSPIPEKDIQLLYRSPALTTKTAKGLQNKVFIDIMLYFCNRGRENLREMLVSDFTVKTDENGVRYVEMQDKLTKNHRGKQDDDNATKARMYEVAKSPLCPVASYVKYASKLSTDCNSFWQRPKEKHEADDDVWYYNSPLGKNTLGCFMSTLSKAAGLSKMYTNHCLRATCVTVLDKLGFESRHIMAVSGHKSENSLKSYAQVAPEKIKAMSSALSSVTGSAISDPEPEPPPGTSHESRLDINQTPAPPNVPAFELNFPNSPLLTSSQEAFVNNSMTMTHHRNTSFNIQNCVVNIHYH